VNAPITYEDSEWLADATHVDMLWDSMPWENREGAPRYEAWMNDYGLPYTYGSGDHARTYEPMPRWHPMVDHIRLVLNQSEGTSYDCCFVNGYAHGRQHLGWHADDSPEMDHEHPIMVISFGAEREIWFRQRMEWKEPLNRIAMSPGWYPPEGRLLKNGSRLIMHAGMQRSWQHRIPKSPVADCGRRISLTYRKLVA
jgi:alkylated DNA repair dioxygenase AlkB